MQVLGQLFLEINTTLLPQLEDNLAKWKVVEVEESSEAQARSVGMGIWTASHLNHSVCICIVYVTVWRLMHS